MSEVLTSYSTCELTPCQMTLKWTGRGDPGPLPETDIMMVGSKGSKTFQVKFPRPASEGIHKDNLM